MSSDFQLYDAEPPELREGRWVLLRLEEVLVGVEEVTSMMEARQERIKVLERESRTQAAKPSVSNDRLARAM
jgi:hypothetical protein